MPRVAAKKSAQTPSKKSTGTPAKRPQSKADFVRGLPGTMPAAEVVAKAKEQGIQLSVEYVYNIRATAKAGARKSSAKRAAPATAKKSSPKVAPKPAPSKPGKPESKSAFVRKQPKDVPAAEVVARAKAAGITMNDKFVWTVRSADRAAKKTTTRKAASKAPVARAAAKAPASSTTNMTAERVLQAVVAELGLAKVFEILEEQRATVRAVLGG